METGDPAPCLDGQRQSVLSIDRVLTAEVPGRPTTALVQAECAPHLGFSPRRASAFLRCDEPSAWWAHGSAGIWIVYRALPGGSSGRNESEGRAPSVLIVSVGEVAIRLLPKPSRAGGGRHRSSGSINEDPRELGSTVHGVEALGSIEDPPVIARDHRSGDSRRTPLGTWHSSATDPGRRAFVPTLEKHSKPGNADHDTLVHDHPPNWCISSFRLHPPAKRRRCL
jgi:hypothetical protein